MKNNRQPAIWKFAAMDLIMAAVIMGVFFLFFSVIPGLWREMLLEQSQKSEQLQTETEQESAAQIPVPDDPLTDSEALRTGAEVEQDDEKAEQTDTEVEQTDGMPEQTKAEAEQSDEKSEQTDAEAEESDDMPEQTEAEAEQTDGMPEQRDAETEESDGMPEQTDAESEQPAPSEEDNGESSEPDAVREQPEKEEKAEPEEPQREEELTLREKYAYMFSEEVQHSELSYSSPNVSVQVTIRKDSEHGEKEFTCYIAEIYLAEIDCLKTGVPDLHSIALSEEIAEEDNAILGINGDYFVAIKKGLIVRNGEVLQEEEGTSDLCILYRDGRMVTCGPEEYRLEDLMEEEPYQVWSFGPALLNDDGSPRTEFNTTRNLIGLHPRTALGYYEPGHYCFVVIDGRGMGASAGATMETLSRVMSDLGCTAAYNLDGGASSSMVFDGTVISRPSGGRRRVSDMILICDMPGTETTA